MYTHTIPDHLHPEPLTEETYDLRRTINEALRKGQLRTADCRHALRLQGAGMPPRMVIEYIQTMIRYTAKARKPK
jgi:hypothetical protein